MQTGMNIGTVVDKDSLGAITEAIVALMGQKADQETIRHGIDALSSMATVQGVTIQNCIVNGDRSVVVEVDAENADASVSFRPTEQK